MKKRLLFMVALILSVLGVLSPLPEHENVGVVWAEKGNLLRILYREGTDYFVREWDFTDQVFEIEAFPYDGDITRFYPEAYALGKQASIVDEEVVVYYVYNNPNAPSGRESFQSQTVYGHISDS